MMFSTSGFFALDSISMLATTEALHERLLPTERSNRKPVVIFVVVVAIGRLLLRLCEL